MIAVIVAGIVLGANYALTGAAFTVAYRSTRILNFAIGGLGGLCSFVFVSATTGLPWVVSFLIAVLIGAVAGGLSEMLIGRRLVKGSPLTAAMGMLGALLIFQGAAEYFYGTNGSAVPTPFGAETVPVFGFPLQLNDITSVVVSGLCCVGLLLVVYHTPLGLAMRAASAGPATAQTLGIRTSMTSAVGWAMAGGLATVSAIFVGTQSILVPQTYSGFMFLALVALVMGGLSSLWGVMTSGVLFGVLLSVLQTEVSPKVTYTLSLAVLVVLLLVRPSGLLGRPETHLNEDGPAGTSRRRRGKPAATGDSPFAAVWGRWGGLIASGAVMILLWWIAPITIVIALPVVITNFIAIVGLDVCLGYCGQLNLAQGAFLGVGAYSAALLCANLGLSGWLALPVGLAGGALVGVLMGLPAVRLAHLYYAQVTLLFAFVVPELILLFSDITGGNNGITLPTLPGISRYGLFLAHLVIAGVVVVAVTWVLTSRPGRQWRAIRDAEHVAKGLGQRTPGAKLWAFALGCGLAGLAGAMQAVDVGTVSPDSYPVWVSIYLQAALVVGGMRSMLGNLLGAFLVTVVPLYTGSSSALPPDLVFGLALTLVLLIAPGGLAKLITPGWTWLGAQLERLLRRKQPQPSTVDTAEDADVPATTVPPRAITGTPVLAVRELVAGYAGSTVLHGVNLVVGPGEVVGVVGPNGAGKSTLLRAVTGMLTPDSGTVQHRDGALGKRAAAQIARSGVAHVVEGRGIFADLTVRENLALARPFGPRENRVDRGWLAELFPRLWQPGRQEQLAGTLSGGEQQMLAIARALLMAPRLLILDEPLLGLAPGLRQAVLDALHRIRAAGPAILVVEQNVQQLLDICDYVSVLAGGRTIAAGEPAELAARRDLMERYFGLDATAATSVRTRTATPDEPLLEVRDVTVRYGGMTAVDAVSLTVPARSRIGIIGPNGAGKSTLLKSIIGDVRTASGSVTIAGAALTGRPRFQRTRLGVIATHQELGLFSSMTVLENVVLGAEIPVPVPPEWAAQFPGAADGGSRRELAREILDRLGLAHWAGSRPDMLPYGVKKLVDLARALATRPRVLLLDEPAAGLNTVEKATLLDRLEGLLDELDVALVLVEHDMPTVARLCGDQVYALVAGRLAAAGPFDTVINDPVVTESYFGNLTAGRA